MKKTIFAIISIFLLFSISGVKASSNGLIENLLNLEYGPITYDLNLEKIDSYTFKDTTLKNTYNTLVKYDKLTRDEIINAYKDGKYDYNTVNGIVRNYKSFVSYTNDFFYFLKQIDKYPYLENDVEVQDGLLKSYRNSQSYYKKVKSLVNKNSY